MLKHLRYSYIVGTSAYITSDSEYIYCYYPEKKEVFIMGANAGYGYGGGFALIVVLFILLIIIGASYVGYGY